MSSSDWLFARCFPIGCLLSLLFSCVLLSLASAFVGVGRNAPDVERLVFLKPVVQFYFTYDVSSGFLYIYLYFSTGLFIYCKVQPFKIMSPARLMEG